MRPAAAQLAAWTIQSPLAGYQLQIALTTLLVSSPSDREATEAVPQEMGLPPFLDGLMALIEAMSLGTSSRHQRFDHLEQQEQTLAAGRGGDFRNLGNRLRHLEVQLPPDAHLAVLLVSKFAPDRLARFIEEKKNVFFSVAFRDALGESAPRFAQLVDDATFKFVCASSLASARLANSPEGSVEVVRDLVLQVAQTEHWRAFLLEFARYPHAETVAESALSEALLQLTPAHWSGFVDAVELWTYAGTAGAVARILAPFLHALGFEKSSDMWRLAFERWDKWNYGHDENDTHMHAPSPCSFDFPVAMHYSQLPSEQLQDEEVNLREKISTVEQKWFSDISELATYRNRLSSRLRLLQHGLAIRNPSPEGVDALPPPIQPENEFAKFRYRFFDVNSTRKRGS